eukprot:8984-Eustigmatos_ZCMA.PRE.1
MQPHSHASSLDEAAGGARCGTPVSFAATMPHILHLRQLCSGCRFGFNESVLAVRSHGMTSQNFH